MNPDTIDNRVRAILGRIREKAINCGRDPESVRLVAVSKTKPAGDIREAFKAGATVFGENYIQEALDKYEQLKDLGLSFHFIGHLQSNKAKYAVRIFDMIHSVDSFKLAVEIDRQAAKLSKVQEILVQVNISMEPTKSGVSENDALSLVREISRLEHLSVRGLMTLPPLYNDPENVKPYFRALRQIRDSIRNEIPALDLSELSMGMTGDFEAAIEEGSTLVRIGTALFGERS